jgi:hypothetical protein
MFRSRCLLAVICIFCGLMLFSASTFADLILAEGKATGQWFNPARDGEGFYVEVIGEGNNIQIAIAMYSYDNEGNQLWIVGNVPISADATVATVPVFLVKGPVWGSGYDPADRETTAFGDVVVRFPTCDTALFTVRTSVALESGDYSLSRLTEIVGMDCTDVPPEQELGGSSGLWTGPGVCFTVNPEGTRIIESDLCDNGKAFSAELPGLEVDVNGEIGTRECQANVVCDGAYPIADGRASCINEVGGVANIYFNSATQATVEVIEGFGAAGDACVGGGTATPAE